MKPSSSSSSSLAFFESHRSDSGGCILGVLRRILCSRSLPSSHHTSDTCSSKDDKDINQAVPGLVARLMGLDSIPERRMITRSRSLNDSAANNDDQPGKLYLHRRSKSSREIPTHLELHHDDEFIVLKFDNRKKSPRTNQNTEKTAAEIHGQEDAQVLKKQQRPAETESRIKKHMIRLVQKTTLASSDTEESSPVSIFDFHEPTSEDDSWTRSSSSSSRVSSPEQECTNTSTRLGGQQNTKETVESRHKAALLNNTVIDTNGQQKKIQMWGNITVAEIKGTAYANWCGKEDLAAEFEVHIMDQLLNDLLLLLHLHSV